MGVSLSEIIKIAWENISWKADIFSGTFKHFKNSYF